jgi:hypothetical protein
VPNTRVNSSSIYGSSTGAGFSVAVGTSVSPGDLILVSALSSGTHVANGMVVQDSRHLTNYTTILEQQGGGGSIYWQQTFFFVATQAMITTDTFNFTPYASAGAAAIAVDIFRGALSTQPVTATGRSVPSSTDQLGTALASAPPSGTLVVGFFMDLLLPTAQAPWTEGSDGATNNAATAIQYVLASDGVTLYNGHWTISAAHTGAVITTAFNLALVGSIVGRAQQKAVSKSAVSRAQVATAFAGSFRSAQARQKAVSRSAVSRAQVAAAPLTGLPISAQGSTVPA